MAARYFGKYAGLVSDNADPDKRAQLKVKVPAVFGPTLEVWARPCLPFGHFFIPEAGTKIWVEFEAGNIEFPIWVGVWYAQGEVPPDAELDMPVNRMIHTPSGHAIELLDEDGEEKILIRHKTNAFVSLDKDGGVLVSAKDGATLEIKDGTVKITADKAVQVVAESAALDTTTVGLGKDASEPAVLGQQFASLWNAFIFHTHATGVGPSGPPTPPANPLTPGNGLSTAVKVK